MTTVFIAGSMDIKHLDRKVTERLDNIINSNFSIIVGDADGVDTSIQTYLFEKSAVDVVVYCSGPQPRNNVGGWQIHSVSSKLPVGSRAFFTAKDLKMTEIADYGLMIWDAKSTGTLSNVIELLMRNKTSVVFVNKHKEFRTVTNVANLEDLFLCMSENSRRRAEEKIHVFEKIKALKNEQLQMFT